MGTGKLYDYKGRKLTTKDMARMRGISVRGVERRLEKGWPVAEIVETPSLTKKRLPYDCGEDCFHCPFPDCVKG